MSKLMVGQTTEASAASPKSLESPAESTTPTTMAERWAALKAVEKELNKQFDNAATLVRLGTGVHRPMPSIKTNLPTLDYEVFGCGGVPRGRIIEIIGPESAGKTTVALHIVGQEQKAGGICAYIDAEHSLDPNYSAKLGVDVPNLLISQPDSGEEALTIVEKLVESKAVSLIVVDSVAALVPQAELDGDMGQSFMGLQARLLSQAMRKLRGIANVNQVTLIFLNQLREKIGVMYGSPETTPGGRALKFYASVRLDVRRREPIKEGTDEIGHNIEIKGIKNKCSNPKVSSTIPLLYGKGLDILADSVQYGVNQGAVQQAGGWYTFKEKRYRKAELLPLIDEIITCATKLKSTPSLTDITSSST